MNVKTPLFVLIFIIYSACSQHHDYLNLAENMMQEKPDSALLLLKKYEGESNRKKGKEFARFSLLMSMALDKNYIDLQSDSIIRPAVEYYASKKGRERMLAYYYLGLVYKNMKSFAPAIISLEKAEADAIDLDDFYQLGLIYRNIAYMFSDTGDNASAISYLQKAVSCFNHCQATRYEQYARLSLATVLDNSRMFNKALEQINLIPQDSSDCNLQYQVSLRKAHILFSQNNPEKAKDILPLYRQIPARYLYFHDYCDLAILHEWLGQKDSADYYMALAHNVVITDAEKAGLDYREAKLLKRRGKYLEAYELIDYASTFQDSLTRKWLGESISSGQRDYYKLERDKEKKQAEDAASSLRLWILVSILIIIIIAMLFRYEIHKKDTRLLENLATLHSNESSIIRLKGDNSFLLSSLLSEKLLYLDKLSDAFCSSDSTDAKEIIFKQYKDAVKTIRNDKRIFSEIEEMLDKYCDNVVSKFKAQFPEIQGEKLQLVIMFFTRLPYKTIQLFFRHHSADSLKQAKNRLRKTVQESGSPDTKQFMFQLEMKKGGRKTKQNDV